jgi:hypothetical protein
MLLAGQDVLEYLNLQFCQTHLSVNYRNYGQFYTVSVVQNEKSLMTVVMGIMYAIRSLYLGSRSVFLSSLKVKVKLYL